MRRSGFLLLLLLAPVSRAPAQIPAACNKKSMAGEIRFDTSRVRELAGQYDLYLVLTEGAQWGASNHHGRLELWLQDSARSRRGPFGQLRPGWERPVAGAFVVASPDSNESWWRRMASADLNHPGVILQGRTLRMGDYDGFDGTGENLTITHVAPAGFRGRWQQDNGIAMMIDTVTHQRVPDPAGYFCARRVSPTK
jgi:hypothetical protein